MEKTLVLLKNSYIKYLAEEMKKKGVNTDGSIESVIDNLGCLVENTGETAYLPLPIKKLLAKAISIRSFIKYETTSGDGWVTVEALFYWGPEETTPAGSGKVKMYLEQIASDAFRTESERDAMLEATARGRAATRALSDAGIGLQYFGDITEPELGDPEPPVEPDIPEITPQAEKKKGRPKKAVETPQPDDQIPEAVTSVSSMPSAEDLGPAIYSHPKKVSSMSLEEAFSKVADMGNCKDRTLKEIYEKQPRNLVWLRNNGSTLTEALEVIMASDKDLSRYL